MRGPVLLLPACAAGAAIYAVWRHSRRRQRAAGGPGAAGAPIAGETPEAALDAAAILRLKATLGKNAAAMIPVLAADFVERAQKLLAEARRACAQGSADELRRAAHTLKSSAATFGATDLSGAARELEEQARSGALEPAADLIARATREFERAKPALTILGRK